MELIQDSAHKKYINVNAEFTKEGEVIPHSVVDDDGEIFEIQRIKDIRRAASLRAGAVGIRFTCIIDGYEKVIFYEDNCKWFVEV